MLLITNRKPIYGNILIIVQIINDSLLPALRQPLACALIWKSTFNVISEKIANLCSVNSYLNVFAELRIILALLLVICWNYLIEQRLIRINQITTAMIELMEDLPFDKITMKKLGEKLSFTRNNLYQYVKSKNEVILLIIQQDFFNWANDLHHSLQALNSASLDGLL